ncbi:oxidation resistance protein 1-like isoform X2 [Durio zibethinus]|uniref:Oxidation resistance protein 1-like isoform X2 n=1 Tax=Durio zibethinus TaxID=66656 RepID=A0A6P6A6F2_DURZI|nr:oxidation resistance protein 1-like isoform X2 [Durio zibethinus]
MNSLREKVAGSLSRLFADSPNHSPPSSPSSPSDLYQARWYSKRPKSLSSVFSYIIPSVSFGGSKSNDHESDLKPIQSLPVRWKNKKFEVQDESLDGCKECTVTYMSEDLKKVCEDKEKIWMDSDDKQTISPRLDKGHTSEGSSSDSDEFHEAREQQSPVKPPPNLSDESVFITSDLYEFLVSSLPNIVKGCQWMLLYSTLKHGISLRTLIRKSAELPGPCLLGTNQTYVFTTIYGEPRLFRPTGANRYYYICLNDLLALGGGGNFALGLDGDLLSGTSGPCETFGNLCLAHNEEFELKNVELWGFRHASILQN